MDMYLVEVRECSYEELINQLVDFIPTTFLLVVIACSSGICCIIYQWKLYFPVCLLGYTNQNKSLRNVSLISYFVSQAIVNP